jgi:hypothetical protein
MTIALFDIIQETTLSSGLGDLVFAGAVGSYLPFGSVLTDGQEFPYTVTDNVDEREGGTATYHAASNSFTRTTVLYSTNGGALVPFGAPEPKRARSMRVIRDSDNLITDIIQDDSDEEEIKK